MPPLAEVQVATEQGVFEAAKERLVSEIEAIFDELQAQYDEPSSQHPRHPFGADGWLAFRRESGALTLIGTYPDLPARHAQRIIGARAIIDAGSAVEPDDIVLIRGRNLWAGR